MLAQFPFFCFCFPVPVIKFAGHQVTMAMDFRLFMTFNPTQDQLPAEFASQLAVLDSGVSGLLCAEVVEEKVASSLAPESHHKRLSVNRVLSLSFLTVGHHGRVISCSAECCLKHELLTTCSIF